MTMAKIDRTTRRQLFAVVIVAVLCVIAMWWWANHTPTTTLQLSTVQWSPESSITLLSSGATQDMAGRQATVAFTPVAGVSASAAAIVDILNNYAFAVGSVDAAGVNITVGSTPAGLGMVAAETIPGSGTIKIKG